MPHFEDTVVRLRNTQMQLLKCKLEKIGIRVNVVLGCQHLGGQAPRHVQEQQPSLLTLKFDGWEGHWVHRDMLAL